MRWLFVDSRDTRENAEREQIIVRMNQWWEAFVAKQNDLKALFSGQSEWDLADWMQQTLQAVSPNLMWEFGPTANGEGHRLVITPEADRQLRPLVNCLLRRAPALPNWEFYGTRLPEPLEDVLESVKGICGGDLSRSLVESRRDKHRRIALTYFCPNCPQVDEEQAQFAAFVATESLVGGALLDRWIGAIHIAPLPKEKHAPETERAWPLDRLHPTIKAIIGSMIDQLPEEPCFKFVPQGRWSGYELRPVADADYPGRTDLYSAITGRPDIFESHHNGNIFFSDTHSKCGESFCYIKYDCINTPDQDRAPQRDQLSACLNQALIPAGIGCVVGGGTGLRYSYIDLALVDIPRAIPILKEASRYFHLSERNWLLFFDDELAEEWIPLGNASPPPPVRTN